MSSRLCLDGTNARNPARPGTRSFARAAIASAAAAAVMLTAGSALAGGGGIRTDQDIIDGFSFPPLCVLGQPCAPTSLGFTVNGVSDLYIYSGIIGLGAPLTGGTTLDTIVGDYLAPAFGAPPSSVIKQFRNAHYEATGVPGITLLNFNTGSGPTAGVYQVAFFNNNVAPSGSGGSVTGNQTVTISFNYGRNFTNCPVTLLPDCGFTATSQGGWRVGDNLQTYAVGVIPTGDLTLPMAAPPAGVPEPATWAMLISGFGLVGLACRRRRAAATAA